MLISYISNWGRLPPLRLKFAYPESGWTEYHDVYCSTYNDAMGDELNGNLTIDPEDHNCYLSQIQDEPSTPVEGFHKTLQCPFIPGS